MSDALTTKVATRVIDPITPAGAYASHSSHVLTMVDVDAVQVSLRRCHDWMPSGYEPLVSELANPTAALFYPTTVIPLCQRLDYHLEHWAVEVQTTGTQPERTRAWLQGLRTRNPELFAHWRYCGAATSGQTARAV